MKRALRILMMTAAVATISACSVRNPASENSSPEEVAQAAYRHNGPTRLTLYTMKSNSTGAGAHTSLLINASQRVAFDPAGSFRKEGIVAANDVVYGMTPYLTDVYTRYHARETFHVVVQSIDVSPEVAELALQRAKARGPVQESMCAASTSEVLRGLPGFEDMPSTYYPNKLSEAFATKGATYARLFEYDSDDNKKVLKDFVPEYETVAQQKN